LNVPVVIEFKKLNVEDDEGVSISLDINDAIVCSPCATGYVKNNATSSSYVNPPVEDVVVVVKTELSKIGKFSLGGVYDAINV